MNGITLKVGDIIKPCFKGSNIISFEILEIKHPKNWVKTMVTPMNGQPFIEEDDDLNNFYNGLIIGDYELIEL